MFICDIIYYILYLNICILYMYVVNSIFYIVYKIYT